MKTKAASHLRKTLKIHLL